MSIIECFETEVQVIRQGAGTWVKGKYIGGPETTFALLGSVQPLNANETLKLPEARRTRQSIKIYSDTELLTASEADGPLRKPDKIIYRGKVFEVLNIFDWDIDDDIPHFKSFAFKIEKQGDGIAN